MKKVISILILTIATAAFAQTRPDDTPKVNIGSTIFADYTDQTSPSSNTSFNVTRAYINVIGNLNHWISFRITPDIVRETGSSSLNGSYTFRLKYAFGQFNLDDWTTHGSWIRLGLNQTPLIDYEEGIYRYRFQGPTFVDREGFLTSSDNGLSGHYVFPADYGDIHAGYYNGEGYAHAEANKEKAFQVRASLRPLPGVGIWNGLRITGFVDDDHYAADAKRTRILGQVTFESPHFNGGLDALHANDRGVNGKGWSLWLNPRFVHGWEALLRHDDLKPNDDLSSQKHKRDIAGVAYWFQGLQKVQSALMVDYDRLRQPGFGKPDDTRYGLKMLINF